MKTPEEKYHNDVEYHRLVDYLESLIIKSQFTPSELREASVLAAIHYEMSNPYPRNRLSILDNTTVENFLKSFDKYKPDVPKPLGPIQNETPC